MNCLKGFQSQKGPPKMKKKNKCIVPPGHPEEPPGLPDQPDEWDEDDKTLILSEIRVLKIRLRDLETQLDNMKDNLEAGPL